MENITKIDRKLLWETILFLRNITRQVEHGCSLDCQAPDLAEAARAISDRLETYHDGDLDPDSK